MYQQGIEGFPYYLGLRSLADIATNEDKVCVLNILGGESRQVTPISHAFSGSNVVFGTSPGRAGQVLKTVAGEIPVYNNVREGLKAGHDFNVGVVYLPPSGVRDGVAEWDGVRNHQAANNMKAMKPGDRAFFYHSVNEKRIVGIVEVVKTYYPDPSDPSGRFGMVDVKALKPMTRPVTLAEIKAEPRLGDLALVRQSRLSVLPVAPQEWALICAMGETEA